MSTIITTPFESKHSLLKIVNAGLVERSALNIHTLSGKKYSNYTPLRIMMKDIVECLGGEYEDFGDDNIVNVGGGIIVSNTLSVEIDPNTIEDGMPGTLPINGENSEVGTNVTWPNGTRTRDYRTMLSGGSDEHDYMMPFDFVVPSTFQLNSTYLIKRVRRIPIDGDHSWIIVYFTNGKTLSTISYRTLAYDGQFQTFKIDDQQLYGYDNSPYTIQYNCSIYPKNGDVLSSIFQISITKYDGKNFKEWAILTLMNDRLVLWQRRAI